MKDSVLMSIRVNKYLGDNDIMSSYLRSQVEWSISDDSSGCA